MIPLKQVRVYIERDADTTVSELLLDIFRVRALLDEQRRKRMAQIVESDAS